jgi:hypothetical protein
LANSLIDNRREIRSAPFGEKYPALRLQKSEPARGAPNQQVVNVFLRLAANELYFSISCQRRCRAFGQHLHHDPGCEPILISCTALKRGSARYAFTLSHQDLPSRM